MNVNKVNSHNVNNLNISNNKINIPCYHSQLNINKIHKFQNPKIVDKSAEKADTESVAKTDLNLAGKANLKSTKFHDEHPSQNHLPKEYLSGLNSKHPFT